MKTKTKWTLIIVGVFLFGVPMSYWAYAMTQPGKYDTFAQCLVDEGVKFYGAFWCPVCDDQKREFGRSAKLLPYVECSPPNRQGQFEVCTEAGVEMYPTWTFSDGEILPGLRTPEELAELTSCELPA